MTPSYEMQAVKLRQSHQPYNARVFTIYKVRAWGGSEVKQNNLVHVFV